MFTRKNWLAVEMLLAVTIGLGSTFTACTGPNSTEKALTGSWYHGDDPPNQSEHQYTLNADHTFTLKGAKETDGPVEFTVKGTWSASPKILCIRFVACTGPACPSPQGIGVHGLGLNDVCTPYRLSGRTLTIIDGRGSTNATDYEPSTPWSRPASSTASTPGSEPDSTSAGTSNAQNPSDDAQSELLAGRWMHTDDAPSTNTSEYSISSDKSLTMIDTSTNDKGEEVEITRAGTWSVTKNLICLHVTSSCIGRGCSPSPDASEGSHCIPFTLSGSTLTLEDTFRFTRQ